MTINHSGDSQLKPSEARGPEPEACAGKIIPRHVRGHFLFYVWLQLINSFSNMAAEGEEMLTSGPGSDLQVGVDCDSSPVISKNRNFRYQV